MRAIVLLGSVVCVSQAVVCPAQGTGGEVLLRIPTVKTALTIEGQPVEFSVWGTVSSASSGAFRLEVTADLADLQQNLTALLRPQLERSDRCGERLSLERAELIPAAPSGVLTASVHYERFACVKAFGKEIARRLVGGNGVVEVALTPALAEKRVQMDAQVRKIEADGSLGEVLRAGSLGDSLRQKIAAGIESAVQKAGVLQSALPAGLDSVASLQAARFADGGSGRLWLALAGEVRVSAEQLQAIAKQLLR